jgi:hypothetical protein
MATLKRLGRICGLAFLLMYIQTSAASNINTASTSNATSAEQYLQGLILAHDVGYGHTHGDGGNTYTGSGRIRSYDYCSRNVFEPCRRAGGSYRECNRRHHLCTYGHTRNCIEGSTC